jgi:hypothetical protein
MELPESSNQLKSLDKLKLKGCGAVGENTPPLFHRRSAQKQLQYVLALPQLQRQQAAVAKLAQQQEPMLTTLERMSWLVVLLATATFIAYLQPPGGFYDKSNVVWSVNTL